MARNKAGNTSDFYKEVSMNNSHICKGCFGASQNDCGKCIEKGKDTMSSDIVKRLDTFIELMGDYVTQDVTLKLMDMGFFDKPASIHHHGKYEGALFDHSLEVTKALVNMTEKLGLHWELERSPYVVGMFHDLCKLDNYVKTENETWEYNNATLLPGHGEKSVIIALTLLGNLTDEELYCIRWHMGAFDTKENWNSYGRACTNYPNVLYTHTADMIAARIVGI